MKHTEETKKKLSKIRKEYLKNNPDKHPWKNGEKHKSKPCEILKNLLKSKNIKFVEEFTPLNDRYFSIDIAFPDKKIGLEVNGNQHYNRDGTLKPYYLERNTLIEKEGWKLYELHYSCCYKEDSILTIINTILDSEVKIEFDYIKYNFKEKVKYSCSCGNEILKGSLNCRKCSSEIKSGNKFSESGLTKDSLQKLVDEIPIVKIAEMFNVSDGAIIKWCKKLDVKRRGRGYWEKIYHNIHP